MKINRLIPMLPVKSMPASISFYEKMGFTVEQRRDEWGWAMLRLDDCRIMIDQSINNHRGAPRESVLYLYPEDIAAYHRHVRDSGIEVPDLAATFYGLIEFRLEDPDGNRWWIGQTAKT
jgi:uncharacterized glyoxalase superfamily protein PhnB